MRTYLYNQSQAIKKLSRFKVGALFMEAGSGKTQTAVGIVNSRNDTDKVLWFTPFQTKENLNAEIAKCGLLLPVEIVGIETLSNSDNTYLKLLQEYKGTNFFCVCDESLKIKNNSIRAKRIIEIGSYAKYRLVLNGTPISKNYLDIYNQMEFLSPKILKMNQTEFYNTFVVEKQLKINGKIKKKWVDSFTNLEYLFALIRPFIFESSLSLDINLHSYKLRYFIKEEEKEEYFYWKERLIEALKNFDNKILPIFQKLQVSFCLNSNKIKRLEQELEISKKEKTIIFYKYKIEEEFLNENFPEILCLSLQKHTFGLNLQDYNKIIFFNQSWDYALMEQAIRRIYRLGQKEECEIVYLLSDLGFEKLLEDNLEKKGNLLLELKKLVIEEVEKAL